MFTLYENIKRLCDEKGVSPSKMCLDIGKSKSLISSLRNGRTTGINRETAQAMADYFGVSVDDVLHGKREDAEAKKDAADNGSVDEVIDLLTDLRDNPDMRMLLHSAKGATADQIRAVAQMLESFKNGK